MKNDQGAVSLEYGLMITLIAVAGAVGVRLLGTQVAALFQGITF